MVYLSFFASALLFAVFSFLLFYTSGNHSFNLPSVFILSTIFVLSSSILLIKADHYKEKDDWRNFRKMLLLAMISGVCFLLSQVYGAFKLLQDNSTYQLKNTFNYTIVLSLVHGMHILIALGLLAWAYRKITHIKQSSAFYVHFLQPRNNEFVKLSFSFWHFLDIVWIAVISLIVIISL